MADSTELEALKTRRDKLVAALDALVAGEKEFMVRAPDGRSVQFHQSSIPELKKLIRELNAEINSCDEDANTGRRPIYPVMGNIW